MPKNPTREYSSAQSQSQSRQRGLMWHHLGSPSEWLHSFGFADLSARRKFRYQRRNPFVAALRIVACLKKEERKLAVASKDRAIALPTNSSRPLKKISRSTARRRSKLPGSSAPLNTFA